MQGVEIHEDYEPEASPLWDEERPAPDSLARVATRLLMQLRLMGTSPAGAIAGDGSAHQKPEKTTKLPQKADDPRGVWERRWLACRTNRERLHCLEGMQDEINQIRYAPKAEKVRGTLDWKLAVATDTRAAEVVGRVYGISARQVKRYRKAHRGNRLGQEK